MPSPLERSKLTGGGGGQTVKLSQPSSIPELGFRDSKSIVLNDTIPQSIVNRYIDLGCIGIERVAEESQCHAV